MAQPVATTARAPRTRNGELSERALGLFLLAPMALVLALVIGYPLVYSLVLSLYRVNLANPEQGQPKKQTNQTQHPRCQPPTGTTVAQEPEPRRKVSTGNRNPNVKHEPELHTCPFADTMRTWASGHNEGDLRISPKTASDLRLYLVAGAGFEPATSGL